AALHVDMFTLHLTGGPRMIEAVTKELGPRRPKILGVTVLTSFDEPTWAQGGQAAFGSARKPAESVSALVDAAAQWGVDGIVCSPHEVAAIKTAHPRLFTVIPGIRPAGSDPGDQARTLTPAQAKKAGADA